MILAAGLAQLPEKLGRSGVAASRAWQGLDHYAPNRHDIGSTTARSVDELALIRDTISHYAPVLIAPLSIQIRRAGVQGGPEFFCLACHPSKAAGSLLGYVFQERDPENRVMSRCVTRVPEHGRRRSVALAAPIVTISCGPWGREPRRCASAAGFSFGRRVHTAPHLQS